MANSDISTKGLDDLGRKFLSLDSSPTEEEYLQVTGGEKASKAALDRYFEGRKTDFIKRAGSFTEDLIAFIIEQKRLRSLSDSETVFGLALTGINLRHHYGQPQGDEKELTAERTKELLREFDTLSWNAQQFWDANS